MIRFTKGNILESHSEALVNTVNTVGVMGKGIALAFKKSFPIVFEEYKKSVDEGEFKIGKVQIIKTGQLAPKFVINFATKKHWRHPSKIEYIEEGLIDLKTKILEYDIESISIPPLGCGNGKLEWNDVKPLMLKVLEDVSNKTDILIYEPGFADQKMIQKEDVKLTPARAMLIHLLNEYQRLGYSVNMLVAQKLAYFLQLKGEPLNLIFEKGHYGPYAHRLLHLLKYLNGFYLWFKEEDNKPGTSITIDRKNYQRVEKYVQEKLTSDQANRIREILEFIHGYESPYGLELLATVDFVKRNTQLEDLEEIKREIYNWTSRKKKLMKPFHIEVASKHVARLV
ncbi:MAG: macro domain-containing protein [Cyclobacteriaceae bacterium]